jgi:hypothetical protein
MEAVPAFSHGEPLTHRDLESIPMNDIATNWSTGP